jgi:hypothetical protein
MIPVTMHSTRVHLVNFFEMMNKKSFAEFLYMLLEHMSI